MCMITLKISKSQMHDAAKIMFDYYELRCTDEALHQIITKDLSLAAEIASDSVGDTSPREALADALESYAKENHEDSSESVAPTADNYTNAERHLTFSDDTIAALQDFYAEKHHFYPLEEGLKKILEKSTFSAYRFSDENLSKEVKYSLVPDQKYSDEELANVRKNVLSTELAYWAESVYTDFLLNSAFVSGDHEDRNESSDVRRQTAERLFFKDIRAGEFPAATSFSQQKSIRL